VPWLSVPVAPPQEITTSATANVNVERISSFHPQPSSEFTETTLRSRLSVTDLAA
jgi:hypothetical protein